MPKVEFVNFDDPFLELKYDGQNYVYNPEYGTLLSVKTDKIVDMPKEVQDYIERYYAVRESIGI